MCSIYGSTDIGLKRFTDVYERFNISIEKQFCHSRFAQRRNSCSKLLASQSKLLRCILHMDMRCSRGSRHGTWSSKVMLNECIMLTSRTVGFQKLIPRAPYPPPSFHTDIVTILKSPLIHVLLACTVIWLLICLVRFEGIPLITT
jgi:hypothetical protein